MTTPPDLRLAVLSDIHGNADALAAVLDDIVRQGADLTLNLGDCFSAPLAAAETWALLSANPMPTVRGNHDRALVDRPAEAMGSWDRPAFDELPQAALDWIGTLPPTLERDGIFACHARPDTDQVYWTETVLPSGHMVLAGAEEIEPFADGIAAGLILFGHSHIPRALRLADGRLMVNPGSVGSPAYADRRGDIAYRSQAGSPDARYALLDRRHGTWTVSLRAVPYDAARMVALARAAGDEDWVSALQTGRVA